MIAWVDALKHMSTVWGKYKIPKKGTKEYDQVKNYQKTEYHSEAKGYKVPHIEKPARKVRKDKGMPKVTKMKKVKAESKKAKGSILGSDTGMEIAALEKSMGKMRKARKDKGVKRGPGIKAIAKSAYKQGLVTAEEAGITRKVRKDKGMKRAPRVKKTEAETEEMFYYA
jgi:hypothetical protein